MKDLGEVEVGKKEGNDNCNKKKKSNLNYSK